MSFPWERKKYRNDTLPQDSEYTKRLHAIENEEERRKSIQVCRNLIHDFVNNKTTNTAHLQQQHDSEALIKALNNLDEQRCKKGGSTYE